MNQTTLVSFVLYFICAFTSADQECPNDNPDGPSVPSYSRAIEGQLVYHNGIRQWMELQPDKAICGTKSIEMFPNAKTDQEYDSKHRALETLRGCRATATGILDIPSTGYYSAPVYMKFVTIAAGLGCVTKPALKDYSKTKPAVT